MMYPIEFAKCQVQKRLHFPKLWYPFPSNKRASSLITGKRNKWLPVVPVSILKCMLDPRLSLVVGT